MGLNTRGLRSAWSLALLAASVNAGCAVQAPLPRELLPEPPPPAPLEEVWAARPARGPSAPFAFDDSTIYLGGSDRRVVALNVATGKERWSRRLSGPLTIGILRLGDTIFAGTDLPEGRVNALDARRLGHTLWATGIGGVTAPLIASQGLIVAASRRGELVALRPSDGVISWRVRVGIVRATPFDNGDGTLTVATLDSLFRVATDKGRIVRRVHSPGAIFAPLVRHGQDLVAGTTDSLVIGLAPDDLTVRWQVRLDAPMLLSPVPVGDALYAVSRVGTVYRIAPGPIPSAESVVVLRWPVTAQPVFLDNLLLVGGSEGILRALHLDGSESWRIALGRPVEIAPVQLPDGLLLMGGHGDLHRYRPLPVSSAP